MSSKGVIGVWLTLLAARGLVVFCLYMAQRPIGQSMQQERSKEEFTEYNGSQHHHYRVHKVHTARVSFFVLN
ncbi:hypothetical protein [Taibaiella koreensis]|uniref:hypothetical protein n=1 Tax=Taibaiella koreensis TaxID=1268548 RepID=UPI000E59EC58|nr:hypothetical protein [Taibaiella koreensis]